MTLQMTPKLVCLNLQRDYLDPNASVFAPNGAQALVHAHSCLAWARRAHVPIVHVHTHNVGAANAYGAGPIAGFEPRNGEALVFKQSVSVFASHEFVRHCAGAVGVCAFVLGFTGAKDCLAAAVDAMRFDARLVFVGDAIASPCLAEHAPDTVDDVLRALLASFASLISTSDLIQLEANRPLKLPQARDLVWEG